MNTVTTYYLCELLTKNRVENTRLLKKVEACISSLWLGTSLVYFINMKSGVIEGFFGPQWGEESRKSYGEFLAKTGGEFYIYAPKEDPFLRKRWRDTWDENYVLKLKHLAEHFHKHSIMFGVGFSPFGIGSELSIQDLRCLKEKLAILSSVGIDLLGLFFDDMPVHSNLAKTQIDVVLEIKKVFHKKIIFCPSYYSFDPILDKVFGARPEFYLEDIGRGIPLDVSIAWTGPKVISGEIDEDHLNKVSGVLKRKPFIWENFFANDGPKNCKYLKIRPYTGRNENTFIAAEAIGLNMMNQPELSKILYMSSLKVLHGEEPTRAFENALTVLCSPNFKDFLVTNQEVLLSAGLDQISDKDKEKLLTKLNDCLDPAAQEVKDWLLGIYTVGSECLTD